MFHLKRSAIILTGLVSLTLLTHSNYVTAQQQRWTNAAGGDFSNAANWDADVPDDTEDARFDLDATYGVSLTGDHSIAGFFQDRGTITLTGGFALNVLDPSTIYDGTLQLDGSGTQFIQAGEFAIGRDGGNAILNVFSGATLTTQNGRLGYTSDASAAATIDGAGSQWVMSSNLMVGRQGAGSLTVQNGGLVSIASSLTVGSSGTTGNVRVTGSGSRLVSLNSSSRVGDAGVAELVIENGGRVTLANLFLGNGVGGNGTVVADGAGSSFTSIGTTVVGGAGSGSFVIRNEATATTGSILTLGSVSGGAGTIDVNSGGLLESNLSRIGFVPGATGEVNVSGTNSLWSVTNQIFVGNGGTGTVSINAGGRTTVSSSVRIGNLADSTGTVNVAGAGSELVTNGLDVGYRGSGVLHVSNGGLLTTNSANLGAIVDGDGVAVVDGAGSRWNNANTLDIGAAGFGSLTVLNGGVVSTNTVDVAQSLGRTGTLRVAGNGSQFLTESMVIGGLAEESLIVEQGGMVHNTGFGGVGNATGTVVVRDSGSHWMNDGQLNVAGDLTIESGGRLTSGIANIGRFESSSTAIVRGTGSTWSGSDSFVIGAFGTGTLEISDGGLVNNAGTKLGQANKSGSLVVRDAGSRLITNILEVGGDGDGVVLVENGGRIDSTYLHIFSSGEGSTSSVTVAGPGSQLLSIGNMLLGAFGTRSGNLSVMGGGIVSVDGPATIDQLGTMTLDQAEFSASGIFQNAGHVLVTGDSVITGGMNLLDSGQIETTGNSTTLINGVVQHNGLGIYTESGSRIQFADDVMGAGWFTGLGDVAFGGEYAPGNSPAIIGFEGDVAFLDQSLLAIELGGINSGEFDQLLIDGDLSLDGSLSVSLLDGLELTEGLEFLVADIGGGRFGQFDGLAEGALIGNFGGTGLYISYERGNGNDIGLFTVSSVPEPSGAALLMVVAMIGMSTHRRRLETPSEKPSPIAPDNCFLKSASAAD